MAVLKLVSLVLRRVSVLNGASVNLPRLGIGYRKGTQGSGTPSTMRHPFTSSWLAAQQRPNDDGNDPENADEENSLAGGTGRSLRAGSLGCRSLAARTA